MRIAIDAMGGDHAPQQIVQGAVEAFPLLEADDQLILVGNEPVIRQLLHEQGAASLPITIEHAPDQIGMHESPVEAVRHKRESSLVKLIKLGTRGAADVLISAGNTGALVAAGVLMLKALPGVERPGIAVIVPTPHGPVMLCDAGANVQPKAAHLHKYAVMTSLYMQAIHAQESPRVGLLNVGTEDEKGTTLVKETHQLLKAEKNINYIGYVEGRTIFSNACDVLVTDGFTGNVTLKVIEGLTGAILRSIDQHAQEEQCEELERLRPVMERVGAAYDHEEYGGALLLGLAGLVLKVHGSGTARAVKSAVKMAKATGRLNINATIIRQFTETAA